MSKGIKELERVIQHKFDEASSAETGYKEKVESEVISSLVELWKEYKKKLYARTTLDHYEKIKGFEDFMDYLESLEEDRKELGGT